MDSNKDKCKIIIEVESKIEPHSGIHLFIENALEDMKIYAEKCGFKLTIKKEFDD